MNSLPPTAPVPYKGGTTLEERMKMRSEQMRKSQKAMLDTFTWESCANCIEWDGKVRQCKKWGMTPPAEVIAIGCIEWEADIPF